ncbi:RibD family protein [Umezakia ovalisporum]|jgi:5-amino-6-(5-phosphoribosylamino)uracil reductase|uniref:RibD family protein n=2 Tax=Umezakia ovalisporum TaxID=75695 RepID=A0AA43KEJ8_9CYAN|nr:RibD family protein [Umezakia ovalisporum]MBI1242822.1 riboflavin deaminase [Nostoc sp. RI_552]MDH6058681.1 RibD family protein [Umezakia ovalisporum FSS-43]MDH6063671.1 RibD family protein [Umezakia ovalisporum FSS-62]MDH6067227.1 RibD family protein [Umezakia ovalisporum APH033B]MDH6070740.1 RibD family protein [Umezakia ovalisporum CobakiLakeA]
MMQRRPHTTVVLAMSADGKIADFRRGAARFGSGADKAHLEKKIAASDAVLLGAGTLRAYGTTLTVSQPILLQHRIKEGKSAQPVHIVITQFADLNPEIKFFQQPIERWLLTTTMGARSWQKRHQILHSTGLTLPQKCPPKFDQIMAFDTPTGNVDTSAALQHMASLHITRLAVLGGGELVASMLQSDLIDELWLTVCPLILGGASAPTPVEGVGFLSELAPRLELLEVHQVEQEVFLHYRLQRPAD